MKFILFVNQPKLLSETYGRYLEGRIRAAEPYPGLPVLLSCRARSEKCVEAVLLEVLKQAMRTF